VATAPPAPARALRPLLPMLSFGEQAWEMERQAEASLRSGTLSPERRDLTHDLLRHVRGITAIAEKWRSLSH